MHRVHSVPLSAQALDILASIETDSDLSSYIFPSLRSVKRPMPGNTINAALRRKPRDFDSELKALADKAKQLKERRIQQLGELVIATGAGDAFDAETPAGALLAMIDANDPARKESWRKRGAAFFQGKARGRFARTDRDKVSTAPNDSSATSA